MARPVSPHRPANSFDFHEASLENVFVGISGLIGAGKTTLATALAQKLGLPAYYEPVIDNAYLADFYRDQKKYSFPMQIYLLNARFKQQQNIIWQGKGGVQDRTIYEDSIFAKMLRDSGLMDARDYDTYRSLFANMSNFMKKPNLIVHLDVSPEESLRRIRVRQRDCETGISLEYLKALKAGYDVFLTEISRVIPVIKVDYEKFRTTEEMASAIVEQYNNMVNIRHVTFDNDASGKSEEAKEAAPVMTPAASPAKPTEAESGSAPVPASGASEDPASSVRRKLADDRLFAL